MKILFFTKKAAVLLLVFILTAFSITQVSAQIIRAYAGPVYSDNLKGGHTMFGNAILQRTSGNGTFAVGTGGVTATVGNDNSDMVYIDVDGVVSTFNSSSADLVLPAGTNTIKFARLYWGGRIDDDNSNYANRGTVSIRKAAGAYATVNAGVQIDQTLLTGDQYAYQAYQDVTAFVNTNGAGSYTVANVATTTGSVGGGGNYGGWALVVVYENLTLSYSSVRVYDGFVRVENNATQAIQLTGLNAPGTPVLASDAYMSTMAWEGDGNLAATAQNPAGDYIKVNGTAVSNAVNPITNFWNGTISKNGAHISTKNPNLLNQMGIDIDEQEVGVGYGIDPNDTQIDIEFGTESDQYFPSIFAFSIKSKPPLVTLDKAVISDQIPLLALDPSENLIYTISGSNGGGGAALSCVIVDTIPSALTYVPGSLKILASPGGFASPVAKTDAIDGDQAQVATFMGKTYLKIFIGTGAVGGTGGVLQPSESYTVQFKCLTPPNANNLNSVSNTARITGTSTDPNDPFVDDGTALIGPLGSPLSVKMTSFNVKKESTVALLKWVTEAEIKNDYYEVERSADGRNYITVGTGTGNGTTNDIKNYQFADPINFSDKIVYYRLKIVDFDNKITYSKIIALRLDGIAGIKEYSVYPNPFKSDVKLQMTSAVETQATLRINNMAGQQQTVRLINIQPGENIIVIKDLDNLKPGMYLLEIITTDGKITQKIVK
ncbi:MAG: T9SS type A sorting domain-containing protein [Chitinophagaceae bacterium]|nr:T9SS type A sorting domain-containing protein [Chitinophagaceae bacterium]